MTVVLKLDPDSPSPEAIERAATVIRRGGLVAFPTETVYGLGANALDDRAIEQIFLAKGRPPDNPLIVHVCDREMLNRVAFGVGQRAERLIEEFWPGPLTLVLQRRPEVGVRVAAGLPTVAVRMPRNRIALDLIHAADVPIAAPSANLSGRPSPTTAKHVEEDLGGRIDMILDGGDTIVGIESTVLDLTADPPLILRPGWITADAVNDVIGGTTRGASDEELRRSPGTRYRHYGPQARLVLIENCSADFLRRFCQESLAAGPVAFLGHTSLDIDAEDFHALIVANDAGEYARALYGALRMLDQRSPRVIVVEGIVEEGEGIAVMDRLRRAASEIVSCD